MILKNLKATPRTNPDMLIGLRDSIYAADLLTTAIVHFNFFSWLADNPSTAMGICTTFDLSPRPVDVMLTLFKSYGLIAEEKDVFHLTETAKEHLTGPSEFSLVPYFGNLADRPIVEKMLGVLKTGHPASWGGQAGKKDWATAMEDQAFADAFTAGMDSRGAYFAPGLARTFDFSPYRSLLDVAGGSGIYAAAIKEQWPALRTAVLEKPPVDVIARRALDKRGMTGRVEVLEGDMFEKEIPAGYDIHLYSHAIHDWTEEQNVVILANSFRNLNPGGIIMVHDAHIDEDKSGPRTVAEYSVLLMFVSYGKCYSVKEMRDLLEEAGFVNVRYQHTVGNRSIVTGEKK